MLDHSKIKFAGKGIIVGIIAGLIVSLFRLIIEEVIHYTTLLYHYLGENPRWIIPWTLVSIAIAIIVGLLIKSDPNIKGSGIPQVEGHLHGEIKLNWWSVLWKKFIGGIFSIGSGLFLGREGPSIQLGSVVGQGVNQYFKGNKTEEKILISSGASAGLSAAFNAPISGLLFILEEVHHNFSPLVGLTALVSALTANFISINIFGLKPALDLGSLVQFPVDSYMFLIILGIVTGLLGLLYQKVVLNLPKYFGKINYLPPYFYGIIPFLLVIPIGLIFPKMLGGGSEIILSLGEHSPTINILIGLFVLRFIFSMVSYGSNLPGGIFLPILSLGGIIGAIYGNVIVHSFGLNPIYIKSFIVFAMTGYFTAIGKAPLTAMILVTELVGSLNQLMPLAVVSISAYITADIVGAVPVYEAMLENMLDKKEDLLKEHKKEIIEIPVHADCPLDEMMIRDVNWPEHGLVISIRRGEKEIITKPDTVIHAGDCLIVLTYQEVANSVRKQIKQLSNLKLQSV